MEVKENVFTQTWQSLLEELPDAKKRFEETKALLNIDKVEVRKGKVKIPVNDWCIGGIHKRDFMKFIVKFEGESRRIQFMAYLQPSLGEWVLMDANAKHLEGKCHVCKHFESIEEDDESFCFFINIIALKYLLEQIKQMKEHRLKFIF